MIAWMQNWDTADVIPFHCRWFRLYAAKSRQHGTIIRHKPDESTLKTGRCRSGLLLGIKYLAKQNSIATLYP